MLQRGRARVGAELTTFAAMPATILVLQRGRARVGAELAMGLHGMDVAKKLQRGRARVGAELKVQNLLALCRGAASTGPRPRGRGIKRADWRASEGILRFNGAAPAWARNYLEIKFLGTLDKSASTGPRPRGRGITYSGQYGIWQYGRFNGAAPAWARNSSCALIAHFGAWCFNGAAPAWARNS